MTITQPTTQTADREADALWASLFPGPPLVIDPAHPTVPVYGGIGAPSRALGLPFPGRNGTSLIHEDPQCTAEAQHIEDFCTTCGGWNIQYAASNQSRPEWAVLDRNAHQLISARLRFEHRVPVDQLHAASDPELGRSISAIASPLLLQSYDMREPSEDFRDAVELLAEYWNQLARDYDAVAMSGYAVHNVLAQRALQRVRHPASRFGYGDDDMAPMWAVVRPRRLLGAAWAIACGLTVKAQLDDGSDLTLLEGPAGAVTWMLTDGYMAEAQAAPARPDFPNAWLEHVLHLHPQDDATHLAPLLDAVAGAHA